VSTPNHRAGARPRPVKAPRQREEPKRFPWKPTVVIAAVVALVGASFVVPSFFEDGATTTRAAQSAGGHGMASGEGDGPDIGSTISFAERDVVSGREISAQTLRGKKTLFFFSEGVMCQACFVQIRDIEEVGVQLEKKGIGLVSITPDSSEALKQAIDQYGISTPMIADDDRDMSVRPRRRDREGRLAARLLARSLPNDVRRAREAARRPCCDHQAVKVTSQRHRPHLMGLLSAPDAARPPPPFDCAPNTAAARDGPGAISQVLHAAWLASPAAPTWSSPI